MSNTDQKREDDVPDSEADARMNDALRRALATKPTPHKPKDKADATRRKRGGKRVDDQPGDERF